MLKFVGRLAGANIVREKYFVLSARQELVTALFFTALILLGLFLTRRIDLAFSSDLETISGPRAYPGLILFLMLFFNLAIISRQLARIYFGGNDTGDSRPLFEGRTAQAGIVYTTLVIFYFAFEPLGYVLTMVPLLYVAAMMNGAPKKAIAALVAVVMTFTCLVVFRYGLNTVLPEGIFGIDRIL